MCQNGALLRRPDFLVGRTATGACGVSSGAERSGRDSDGREVGTIPSGIGGRSSDGGCVGAGGNGWGTQTGDCVLRWSSRDGGGSQRGLDGIRFIIKSDGAAPDWPRIGRCGD